MTYAGSSPPLGFRTCTNSCSRACMASHVLLKVAVLLHTIETTRLFRIKRHGHHKLNAVPPRVTRKKTCVSSPLFNLLSGNVLSTSMSNDFPHFVSAHVHPLPPQQFVQSSSVNVDRSSQDISKHGNITDMPKGSVAISGMLSQYEYRFEPLRIEFLRQNLPSCGAYKRAR